MNLGEKLWELIFQNDSCTCKGCLAGLLRESRRYKSSPMLKRLAEAEEWRDELELILAGDHE